MGTLTPGDPIVWNPFPGAHGPEVIRYQLKNSLDEWSNFADIRIVVNTPPMCRSETATVMVDTALAISKLPCEDADGDLLRDIAVGDPEHGTVTAADDGSVVYTPAPGYVGPDSFTFGARDIYLGSGSATMSISVTGPPSAVVPTPTPTPVVAPAASPTPPAAAKDTTAPTLTLKNASKKQAVAIAVTTNEIAATTLTLALDKALARKLKLSRTVGTAKAALRPGTSTLKIKLSSKAAKQIKKLKKVKLTVTAVVTDAAGNKTTKTLAMTLKK